jgi:tetratricopeptide (TPR) repeat protein
VREVELLARAEPIAMLRDALANAESGRGGLVLVVGDQGIGKTSLVGSIAAEAEKRGADVVHGRAWELAESPPYFPLWECFRSLEIERATETDPFRLWELVLSALAEKATRRTVVWVIDDLHAADLLTLDLLTFLARPARAINVLILATARDKDSRISTRGAQRLSRMARDGMEVRLGPLPRTAVSQLVERVSGRQLAGLGDLLFARTEGNPLFVVECARVIRDTAPGTDALRSLPPTIRLLVLERVAPLPEDTRAVLEGGAVLGREFSSGRVARLLGRLPAQAIEALRPALDAGIVAERKPGHFIFTHILVRDAVEQSISASRAIALHERAEAILASEGDGVDVLVERARHALASMKDEAAGLALRAAGILENEGAFDRALAMHERLDEARAKGHLKSQSDDEKLHRATLLQATGRYAEAEAICDAIASTARATANGRLLARTALVRGAELRPGVVTAELVALLRASLAMPPEDPRLVCQVKARLAAALQPAIDLSGPVKLAREAIAEARELSDSKLLLDVLNWAGAALVDVVPHQERIRLNEELFEGAMREGIQELALRAQLRLGFDRIELGEFSEWPRIHGQVRDLSIELGHPRYRWRALLFMSMRSLARGDVVSSERAIVEVKELSGLYDDPALALSLGTHLGQAARLLHKDDDIRRFAAHLDDYGLSPTVVGQQEITVFLRMAYLSQLEEHDALERLWATASRLEPAVESFEPEPTFFSALFAQAASVVGDDATCRRIRARFAGRETRHLVSGHVPFTYEGPVARICGLLDARLLDMHSAERLLRSALEDVRGAGLAPWVAQIEYDLGRLLADAGRLREAEPLLESSERAAIEIGMPGLAMRASARRQRSSFTSKAAPTTLASTSVNQTSVLTMQREADGWRVRRGGLEFRLKDSRGMQLLARLVERAGEEIHVLALGSDEPGKSLAESSAGPIIDARARALYTQRLTNLTDELDEAEANGDRGRQEKLQHERAALESELLAALGTGGRSRGGGSASERARVNVQRRLKDAIARIADIDPATGAYLERAVRTGTYCRYGL